MARISGVENFLILSKLSALQTLVSFFQREELPELRTVGLAVLYKLMVSITIGLNV